MEHAPNPSTAATTVAAAASAAASRAAAAAATGRGPGTLPGRVSATLPEWSSSTAATDNYDTSGAAGAGDGERSDGGENRQTLEDEIARLRSSLALAEERWRQQELDVEETIGAEHVITLADNLRSHWKDQPHDPPAIVETPEPFVAGPSFAEGMARNATAATGTDSEEMPFVADAEQNIVVGDELAATGSDLAAHIHDGQMLFEMLDRDGNGTLGRRDARAWFRSLGWCLDNATLDSMLGKAHEIATGTGSNAGGADAQPRWQFVQLLAAAERYRDLCGPDPQAIHNALLILSQDLLAAGRQSNGGFVNREALRATATLYEKEGGLSGAEFDELLDLCGVASHAKSLRLETVVDGIVDTICHPKASSLHRRATRAGGGSATPTAGGSRRAAIAERAASTGDGRVRGPPVAGLRRR